MNSLLERVNADPVLSAVPVDGAEPVVVVDGAPVLATPATIVTFGAGVAAIGGVVALAGAGYAMGRAIGGTKPVPK